MRSTCNTHMSTTMSSEIVECIEKSYGYLQSRLVPLPETGTAKSMQLSTWFASHRIVHNVMREDLYVDRSAPMGLIGSAGLGNHAQLASLVAASCARSLPGSHLCRTPLCFWVSISTVEWHGCAAAVHVVHSHDDGSKRNVAGRRDSRHSRSPVVESKVVI